MDRQARARIYDAGSTSSVDLTLTVADLAEFPVVNSPSAFLLEGRTESRPWSVDVVDVGSTLSANLSDSTGRMDIMGRLADFQTNDDGGGWNTKATGRISDVFLNDNVTSYTLFIGDERLLERRSEIFTSSTTCRVYPPGLAQSWRLFFTAAQGGQAFAKIKTGNMVHLAFSMDVTANDPIPQGVQQQVIADIVDRPVRNINSTSGNFKNLRWRYNATDYEISSLDSLGADDNTFPISYQKTKTGAPQLDVWVVDPSSSLGDSTNINDDSRDRGLHEFNNSYLHMSGAEPSEDLPLHIFSSSGDGKVGIPPMALLRRVLNGDFGGSTFIRVSSSAMDDLDSAYANFDRTFFRITKPQNMAEWNEEFIYQPYGVTPYIDAQGRIAPRSNFIPNDGNITSTDLFEFTGANMESHPTWEHSFNNLVTVVRAEWVSYQRFTRKDQGLGRGPQNADRLEVRVHSTEYTNDRSTTAGRFIHTIKLHGLNTASVTDAPFLANEILDRWGDGPITGTIVGLSTSQDEIPGNNVRLTLDSYPNPESTSGRGTTRLVQLTEKVDTPTGPEFTYNDLGPNVNASTGPSFTIARSTADPKHAVVVTVTGGIPTNGGWRTRFNLTTTSTMPSTGSDGWILGPVGTSTGTFTHSRMPSNQFYHSQIQGHSPHRIRSDWSSGLSTQLEAITAPTAMVQQVTERNAVEVSWTVGDADYGLALHVDPTTSATLASSNFVQSFPPAPSLDGALSASFVRIDGLEANNTYLAGIRHFDPFDGVSDFFTTTLVTSTVSSTGLEAMADMHGVVPIWGNLVGIYDST